MAARAATRTGASRRSLKRRTIAVEQGPTRLGLAAEERDLDDWAESDADRDRLEEAEMEILLTGRAATHGNEAEDNWLIETDDISTVSGLSIMVDDDDDETFDKEIDVYRLWPFNAGDLGRP